MNKRRLIGRAANVVKAIHLLTDDEKKLVFTMSKRVAALAFLSCKLDMPVPLTRTPKPADVFLAVAESAGCAIIPGVKGCKGSSRMLCGPGVKENV